MATRIFTGDAAAVAQVNSVTIDTFDAATTYTFTINGKTVSVVGITDVAATTAALEVAFNASVIPEFAEITALDDDIDTITLTADTEGTPFTVTLTVSGGTGTVTDTGVTTANDGPEVWSAANFKDATGDRTVALPGAGDTVIIEDFAGSILYNLDQNAAGDISVLDIRGSFTGEIGLPQNRTGGATDYDEYRQRYLLIEGSAIDIGRGAGGGSPKIRLSLDGLCDALIVHATSSSSDDHGALEIDGNGNTITALTVISGSVDVARDDATAGATITTLVTDAGATVFVDQNCTLATVSVQGGTVTADVGITTITIHQGTVTHNAGNIGTANVLGGSLLFANTAALTVTTTAMGTAGVLDTNAAAAVITLTNIALVAGETIEDPDQHFVLSNPATNPGNALLSELGLNVGRGFTLLWA